MIPDSEYRRVNDALLRNLGDFLFSKINSPTWADRHAEIANPQPPLPFEKSARPLPAGWRKVDGGRV